MENAQQVKIAIVLHLYYADMWGYYSNKFALSGLDNKARLFVTVTESNPILEEKLKKEYPNSTVIKVENRGRDVLPFLIALDRVIQEGYEILLKVHTKKSKHRKDGERWLNEIVDPLLSSESVNNAVATLEKKQTGIIGPYKQYLPLAVNLSANGKKIKHLLRENYGFLKVRRILNSSFSFGFFAGSMFWARVDAVEPILRLNIRYEDFEPEMGQIDGTLAHAIERVFNLIPEIEGKEMYEVNFKGIVRKIKYSSQNIPEWSDLYTK